MKYRKNIPKPPKPGEWLLNKMHDYSHFGSLGDLEEEYHKISISDNENMARLWYWKQVLTALPGYIRLLITWRLQMLRHYVTISLRNIIKNKRYSFINIFGLSVSLSIGFIIMQILFVFYSYDKFHMNKDRIYRVTSRISTTEFNNDLASTPLPLASLLLEGSPEIEKITRLKRVYGLGIKKGKSKFSTNIIFSDPEFFDIFSFDFKYGNPDAALINPYSIVLTYELSQKLFGDTDPTGKMLRMENIGEITVTGVFEEQTDLKSHIHLEPLMPAFLISVFERKNIIQPCLNNWDSFRRQYTYFKIKENCSISGIKNLIESAAEQHYRQPERKVRFRIQKLLDILPGNSLNDHTGTTMPMEPIYIVTGIAVIIALVAGFNYTNLSIARAVTRTREVGVRKVLGAKNQQLFSQFIGEAVIISIISFFSAYTIYRAFLLPGIVDLNPLFMQFFIFKDSFLIIILFFGFAVFTGISAGFLPAKYISKMTVAGVFRFSSGLKIFAGITLRKVLIITQFTFSLVFIISAIIAYNQSKYINEVDIGFNTENIINVDLRGTDYKRIRQKLTQESKIRNISACDHLPGTGSPGRIFLINPSLNDSIRAFSYSVDRNFIRSLDIKLIAGRDFPAETGSGNEKFILINELAAERMGFDHPAGALGKMFLLNNNIAVEVIGVVKNFAKASAHDLIEPCLLQYSPDSFGYLNICFTGGNIFQNARNIEILWKKNFPEEPFTYNVYSEAMEAEHSGVNIIMKIVGIISICALMVSLLGLIGIVDYSMKIKVKEIGVRKVLGADTIDIIRILSKEFIRLLFTAVVLALIPAYFLNSMLMTIYAKHTPLKIEFFAVGAIGMLAVGLFSILTQTFYASQANPANVLKDD